MSNPNQSDQSTLSSVYNNVTGMAQAAYGSVVGNQEQQEAGADKRDVAAAQDTVSHSAVKVGGYTASATGAVTEDDPRRSEGSWNSTIGAGKEAVGGLVGSESLRQQGIEQNQAGKAQEAQGQVSDFSGGVADRVKGAAGSTAAQFMGNREDQQYYQEMHDKGKTQQRGAEYDIQRQNPQ